MRVNSSFTGFSNNRRLAGSCITIMLAAIFFIASSFKEHPDPVLQAKQVNLIIRQIGHRLLLQAGDLNSRVLPVTESKDGTFMLKFESEFLFSHDSLMLMSKSLLPKALFPSGYTVTVHDCTKGEIVYGFQFNNTSSDILACSGRNEPRGCYTIEFTFPDFYETEKQNKTDIRQLTESVKADRQKLNSKLEELNSNAFDYDVDARTGEPKSIKVAPNEVDPKSKELKTRTSNYSLMNMAYIGITVLLGGTLLLWRFRKIAKPLPVENQNQVAIKEPAPELPALGKFLFDAKSQRLFLDSEVISLTDKECQVLELLYKNFGELIPRDTLMQEVWINEGVITGRSLDMFVSKLRKKLSGDPDLRITNVHGKGYKLGIPETQIS